MGPQNMGQTPTYKYPQHLMSFVNSERRHYISHLACHEILPSHDMKYYSIEIWINDHDISRDVQIYEK